MRKVGWLGTAGLIAVLLSTGLWLRVHFVNWHPFVAGDSSLYLDIAQSWIDAHTYGLSTLTVPRPTLIRLPGYPMVLAALQLLFPKAASVPDGDGIFELVEWVQVVADLGTCCLLAHLAWRNFGRRSGLVVLALSTLCPFSANYTAAPLTETFVLFLLTVAYWGVDGWRRSPRAWLLVLTAGALGYSILLRPDQGLLGAAVLPLFVRTGKQGRWKWQAATIAAVLSALPLVPWTIRNERTFHVFQPLAPKSAVDPGESYPKGFQHWFRTFALDFTSTGDAYWNYPENAVDPNDLPARAFDTPSQRSRTYQLLTHAASYKKLQPATEKAFQELAEERNRTHPLRSYVLLPVGRLLNMLLHPRVEMLPIDTRWWRYSLHPGQTLFAAAFGLLNLAYMILAALGLPRAWLQARALTASMCAYFLLRCALLLTLDNAEQRYTMEFLPLYFFFAAALFAKPYGDNAQ